jgi:hypothetical protein
MSQRESGYERKERDLYETPAWVTDAVIPHLPAGEWGIWEPAAGSGKMVKALCLRGYSVTGTDIDEGKDFLLSEKPSHVYAIVTNPPYALADGCYCGPILTTPRRAALTLPTIRHFQRRSF